MFILPRILTAIIGIPIIVISIYYGSGLFIVVLCIILFYILKEYIYMVNTTGYEISSVGTFIVGIAIFFSIIIERLQFFKPRVYFTSIILTLSLLFFSVIEIFRGRPVGSTARLGVGFAGAILFSWSLAHIFLIREIRPKGFEFTLILFVTIWISDTFAYIFGSLWGKKKLAEKISPKKSVVGLISGIVGGVMTIVVLKRLLNIYELNYHQTVILGIVVSVLAVISDLTESLIKRDCGFKDSDNLLPGHGGMMDRFDSFIFTSPVYFYLLTHFLNLKP